MGGSVKNAWDDTVGKATDTVWNKPTKSIRSKVRRAVGDHVYNLGSAVGSAIMGNEVGALSRLGGSVSKLSAIQNQYNKFKEDDVVKAAYITAGAIGAIGALGAAGGVAAGGAEIGGATATTGAVTTDIAASEGISSGTALALGAIGLSGASTAYGVVQSKKAAEQQAKAQARAEANAASAARESEIMRKQALLASQKSMAARRATAGAIANKLKNTTTSLGSDEEKLGD